ncbi:putative eka-like protein [Erysiphe necator]|uniref:Putative eka-like protein n=1 Tax=Uncinula necator TaxID=52586 RepID=A0A0B1P3S6_UNCNE|nr:putative eka-like protein [Erysiphe necator]
MLGTGGAVIKVLGLRITRNRANRKIYLNQEQNITGVLDKVGITNARYKRKSILAADYKIRRLSKEDDTRINVKEYQQAIGSLMFAMIITRPDIAFILRNLSQSVSYPAYHLGNAL